MRDAASGWWTRRVGLLLLSLFVGLPLFVVLATSLTPLAQIQQGFRWLPRPASVRAYADMWTSIPLARYLVNSLLVSAATTLLALAVGLPAAYVLARSRGRGPRLFGLLLIATQAVPGLLFLLPLFLLYAKIQDATGVELIGSYPGLIVTDLTFALPVAIWTLANSVAAVPPDIEEAARLDGAGTGTVLLRVVLPAIAPGIVACSLFAFLTAWGEVLFATVLTDDATATVPVGLHGYATQSTVYWNQLTAAALTSSLPVLAAVWVVSRFASATGRPQRSRAATPLDPHGVG
jgi:multiple sugar transport system permease protein